ncbi:MAG TPA: MlaD family protein [Solirubrobacteraceae bacterium]|nr:MlaD family protein [Solirubrobacteraceae bacterium]
METRAPGRSRVTLMVLFALSCVGLLIFLWLAFGGSSPLAPQGYRIKVVFPYADELANQADVRIAGVSVGSVVATAPAPSGGGMLATLQIGSQYAPLRADTRAILRTKTILGETYVELTPGERSSPPLQDGATLPRGQVVSAVQLDQIFDTFNGPTRRAFQVWQQQLATALRGNGQNLSDVLGNLPAFAGNAADILNVLNVQQAAVKSLVGHGAQVFAAINRDPAALAGLMTNGDATFAATASQNRALALAVRQFPHFLDESKATFADLQRFSPQAAPVLAELEPVARQLTPTLAALHDMAPSADHLFSSLGPLIRASRLGLPATTRVLGAANPLLAQLGPFLEQLNPILGWLSEHQQLLSDFISNGAASLAARTTAFGGGGSGHYLRQFAPEGPETFALQANRDPNNRGNTYPPPVWLNTHADFVNGNFPSFDCHNTGSPGDGSQPASSTAPACWVAPPLPGAQPGQIPHLLAAKYPSR